MSDKEFDINAAITEYNAIAAAYQGGWSDLDSSKKKLEELNKKCADAGVVFKADVKSLELHIQDDDDDSFKESYSTDDGGNWGGDSYDLSDDESY